MPEPGSAAFGALDATVQTADNQPEPEPVEQPPAEPASAEEDTEKASD